MSAAAIPRVRRADPVVALAGTGGALMAAASWWVAATPVRFAHDRPGPFGWFPAHGVVPFAAFYLGLATLCIAWLALGRAVLRAGRTTDARRLHRFLAAAGAPFLLAAPFGRDLWAYAAQGNVLAHGLDPYRRGPAAVPGSFTAEVSGRWVHSPSPYGPLWLRLSQFADWLSGGHPTVAALLLRLPAAAGLAMCAWALGELARRAQVAPRLTTSLWLGLASPLTLVLGLGGGHNDLIMVGLAACGLAVAARPGPGMLACGAALATTAVLVKSPAAVVVAFTVPVWLSANGYGRRLRPALAATAVAGVTGAATVGAGSAAALLGLGWTRQVNADAQWVSWLSLPSGVGMFVHAVDGTPLKAVDTVMRACRNVGEALAVAVLVGLWLLAVRAARTAAALGLLATALGATALLAPSVQPWYYCWGLLLAGLAVTGRSALSVLAAVGLMFAVMITPDGFGLESGPWAPLIVAASVAVCWFALRRVSSPDDDRADHSGPEVRTDDRSELGHV